jgi:hypothetical protein
MATLWPIPEAFQAWPGWHCLIWCNAALFITLGTGLFTPIAALLCLLLKCSELIAPGTLSVEYLSSTILASLALLLLGPGAYSLDAQLYGRRELILRPKR